MVGSEAFDEEDDDWATDVNFEPEEKYFQIDCSVVKGKDWVKVLELSEGLVREYLKSESLNKAIFKNAEAITTGFDDGELVRIK